MKTRLPARAPLARTPTLAASTLLMSSGALAKPGRQTPIAQYWMDVATIPWPAWTRCLTWAHWAACWVA